MARQANKGFLLRLDPATMEQVEKWAAREFRSVNGQLQWIVAESLRRHGRMRTIKKDTSAAEDQDSLS